MIQTIGGDHCEAGRDYHCHRKRGKSDAAIRKGLRCTENDRHFAKSGCSYFCPGCLQPDADILFHSLESLYGQFLESVL